MSREYLIAGYEPEAFANRVHEDGASSGMHMESHSLRLETQPRNPAMIKVSIGSSSILVDRMALAKAADPTGRL